MTEELPPIWALDRAVRAVGYDCDWAGYETASLGAARDSIIAHARTIAQYEQPPVDEDEEALNRIFNAVNKLDWSVSYRKDRTPEWPAALAQFKRELEGRK